MRTPLVSGKGPANWNLESPGFLAQMLGYAIESTASAPTELCPSENGYRGAKEAGD